MGVDKCADVCREQGGGGGSGNAGFQAPDSFAFFVILIFIHKKSK